MPLLLCAGNFSPLLSPTFPPPNPTRPGSSVPSHPCPVGSQASPSTFPRGQPAPQRSFWADQRGAASLPRLEDVKLCSLQRSMLTKDRHAEQLRKPLSQPVSPIPLPAPARRGCSPRGPKAPVSAAQPPLAGSPPPAGQAPAPMALRKPALGTGTAQRWLGARVRLGPAPSPLLSLLLPPWLWVLSILNRLGFQRLFNSFLGSAFSLYVLLVWFYSLPFHFQPAQTVPCARGGQQQDRVQDAQGKVHWCKRQTFLQAGCYRILPSVLCASPLSHGHLSPAVPDALIVPKLFFLSLFFHSLLHCFSCTSLWPLAPGMIFLAGAAANWEMHQVFFLSGHPLCLGRAPSLVLQHVSSPGHIPCLGPRLSFLDWRGVSGCWEQPASKTGDLEQTLAVTIVPSLAPS